MEAEDNGNDNSTSSSLVGMWIGIGVVLLPILYILSCGPIIAIWEKSSLPDTPIRIFYMPLAWLYDQFSICEQFLDWYLDMWGVY